MHLKDHPELMTVIINIQNMTKKIGKEIPFTELENKNSDELHELQDELIPEYNKAVQQD